MAHQYYIANTGDDGADGLSISTPWQTIAKVNASTFSPGDNILLKRGGTWRERPMFTESGSAGNYILLGAYGYGAKPLLLGSVDLSATGAWTDVGSNIWSAAVAGGIDVGNLIFDNEASAGVKYRTIGEVTTQGDFAFDPDTEILYVYSASNPGAFYAHIEAATKGETLSAGAMIHLIDKSYIIIQNLDIRYEGATGVMLHQHTGGSHIIVEHCDCSWIGGCYQDEFSMTPTRFGNGLTVWANATDHIVRYCRFDQIFDVAFDYEANEAGAVAARNYYYGNVATRCSGGFVSYSYGAGASIDDMRVCHNVFYNNGGSWSDSQRLVTAGYGAYIVDYDGHPYTNCVFKNNIFHTSSGSHWQMLDLDNLSGWDVDYNCYYPDKVDAFWRSTNYALDEWQDYTLAEWQAATGEEVHSFAADPGFVGVAGGDLHLAVSSPCIDAGAIIVDVGQTSAVPDIGAREFGAWGRPYAVMAHQPKQVLLDGWWDPGSRAGALLLDGWNFAASVFTGCSGVFLLQFGLAADGARAASAAATFGVVVQLAGEGVRLPPPWGDHGRLPLPRHFLECPRCGAVQRDQLFTRCPRCGMGLAGAGRPRFFV